MRKLVLGIIALVCLDLGFVAYTSVDLRADIAVQRPRVPGPADLAVASTSAPLPPVSDNSVGPSDIAAIKTRPEDISDNRDAVRLATQRRVSSVKARSRINQRIPADRNQPLFEPIVFYVPGPSAGETHYIVAKKDTRRLQPSKQKQAVKQGPKPENRSLVARAWPVVKKPYEWVKALGSKFN